VLKLIDFGIAKAINNDTTNIVRDSQVGTINYMSPEAIMDTSAGRGGGGRPGGGPVLKQGRASDIWSLGCILYQMVYGRTPFADLSLIQKLHAICDATYALAFPDCGNAALVEVMQACLQRDPGKRPPLAGHGGLLSHPFLRPQRPAPVAVAAAAAAAAPALPPGAIVLSAAQLAEVVAAAVAADRAAHVPRAYVTAFAGDTAAAVAAALAAPGECGSAAALAGLPAALLAAARARTPAEVAPPAARAPPSAPAPKAAAVAAGAAALRAPAAAPPAVPLFPAGSLQAAIASKAAELKHVDKENVQAERAKALAAGGPAGPGGGGGDNLLAAMRRGLNDKFQRARAGEADDTTEMDLTATWTSQA
jgi:serine/threonine-protein kinase TTK/MPS1